MVAIENVTQLRNEQASASVTFFQLSETFFSFAARLQQHYKHMRYISFFFLANYMNGCDEYINTNQLKYCCGHRDMTAFL